MAWSSTAPDVIDALVAALSASTALSGVPVLDGPVVTATSAQDVVYVGFVSDDEPTAVDCTIAAPGMASSPNAESYTVHCAALSLRGSTDVRTCRRQAYTIVGAAGAALAADLTLGGTCARAYISSVILDQQQTAKGALATLRFDVQVDAFTTA